MRSTPGMSIVPSELERKIALSRWALGFEAVWPRLWLPAGVAALFCMISLGGLWPLLETPAHIALLTGFGLAAAGSLLPLVRLRWPTRQAALERLEHLSGVPHRPATSYQDQLAADTPAAGPTASLWAAHRRRLARLIGDLKPRLPKPRTDRRDPLALRALLLLGLAVSALAAGDAISDRFGAAFRFGPAEAVVPTRLDAWVTPPAYTGQQTIVLTDAKAGSGALDQQSSSTLTVPEGSVLTVRAAGPAHGRFSVQVEAGAGAAPLILPEQAKADSATALSQFLSKLESSATVRVMDGATARYSWQFQIAPSHAPTIALTKEPQASPRGSLILDYRATDDYGVASAGASFVLADLAKSKPLKLADGTQIDPLGEAPKLPLKLSKTASMKDVKGHSSLDLTSHVWAGQKVRMTLTATNHAGQTGAAEPAPFVLPERQFHNPLARAIIEQRRKLAFSPGDYLDVRYALDALAIAPEDFPIAPADYLALRSVYRQLTETPAPEIFKSVTDQLWDLAMRLENGQLSAAEQALKAAEDNLAKALEDGASDSEIAKRMAELRQALNQFLKSLAEQGPRPDDPNAPQQNATPMTAQDFEQMLKRMEQMSQSGNKNAAEQMLAQMRDMLDRLQSGKMANNGQNGKMRQMLDKFGNLIGKQKKLLDETFKKGRDQRNGQPDGQGKSDGQGQAQGQPGDQQGDQPGGAGGLDQRQGDLRNELDELTQELNGATGGKAPEQLQGAGRSMDDARQALQNDDPDSAAGNQGKALDQLRKGAQALAEQLRKGQGDQQGNNNAQRDPLGRSNGQPGNDDSGLDNSAELPIDGEDVQRSREIIEELRRRLGEARRPPSELDYLERLLK